MLYEFLLKRGANDNIALILAGWTSTLLAATACSIELAVSDTIAAGKVVPAMLSVHALIGVGEALVTLILVRTLDSKNATTNQCKHAAPFLGALLTATLLSPFACTYPDGLEWVAGQYGFLKEGAPLFIAPLPDYTLPALGEGAISTALSGLAGVILVGVFGAILVRLLQQSAPQRLAIVPAR
ncbi:PDGLE domain-containing protein [Propionivibrio limicola]|uniref:PDGLE domain-containing protein n=1 Tax=Propionivibrio limicola TaxID=167645 RepID=UPI001B867DDB|nr:PDGLE domain-containing protein [Propionivibrio limicola]